MPTFTSFTNPIDNAVYINRAKNEYLVWCSQVMDILGGLSCPRNSLITDIGCNYGQLYKEIKKRGLHNNYEYSGYDIDDFFLGLAKRHFPELQGRLHKLDIENELPNASDITVCSATLEHIDNPELALQNMLSKTSTHMILRTFVGPETINFIQDDKELIAEAYNINQFNLYELSKIFFDQGFDFRCIKDKATKNSGLYEVHGVLRQMYIIVASKQMI
jgi:SAM-dependent methyltransferase